MAQHSISSEVRGPWSLATSRAFWEGFGPAELAAQAGAALRTVFRVEADWSRAEVVVEQHGAKASITVTGPGDLAAAAAQTARFLALDVDATAWPEVGQRDPVIGAAQKERQGLRPCGFHSPYEAAAWSVLSQRIRITQAAKLRTELIAEHGEEGAFPAPETLRRVELDLPGRKAEYLQAVAEATLDGQLDGVGLRELDPADAMARIQQVKGLGPFAAELVLIRGANAPDVAPTHERRLEAEVAERYGAERTLTEVSEGWRPFRTWASVYLRSLREQS